MSSTVSDSSSDSGGASSLDIDLTAQPTVVTWRSSDGQLQSLPQLKMDLHYSVHSDKAFFKLCATITLKPPPRANKTTIYLFIYPERIQTLAIDECPSPRSASVQSLGSDVTCLRFDLSRPPALVLPKYSLQPRNKLSGDMLNSFRFLAQQTSFAACLNIPGRTLPRGRLLSLCEAASRHDGLKSIAGRSGITSLYSGHGGRIVEGDSIGISTQSAARNKPSSTSEIVAEDPPSYEEVPPGPRSPLRDGPSNPNKRRRRSSEPVEGLGLKYIEDICSQLVDRKLADLRREMTSQLRDLETRLRSHIDERLSEQREDVEGDVNAKIEDGFDGLEVQLQDYLQDYLQGEMKEAEANIENNIMEHISSASVSLQFNT
ncbi:hypothetical protein F4809DRAFT_616553 [Biscogniauxia mediterranea]|nr:hypothetical protein F4809DRAFT_616553 [Biscogniauxia mediterranea]